MGAGWLGFNYRQVQGLFPFLSLLDLPSLLSHGRGSIFPELERTEHEDDNLNFASVLGMRGAVSPLVHISPKGCF